MRKVLIVCIVATAFVGGTAVAYPLAGFDPASGPLTEHEKILEYQDQKPAQPYAMNLTDEAAQTMGLHNGRLDVIGPGYPDGGLMPNVSGAMDGGKPMLKLQWRLGQ